MAGRPFRRRLLGLAVGLWGLSLPGYGKPVVTFDIYPKEAAVYKTAGTLPLKDTDSIYDMRNPLVVNRRPVDLGTHYKDGQLNLIVAVPEEWAQGQGRKPLPLHYLSNNPKDGEVVEIYLHPVNPLEYFRDFRVYRPNSFAATCLGLAVLLAGLGRRLLARRASQALAAKLRDRRQVLESVGAEYEREFGRWLVVGKIGSGGMGEVLRAFPADDVRRDTMVAIKLRAKFDEAKASKELNDREKDERARFAIETKVLCTLNHPGIVKVYDWGEIDGRDYYAMELVQGENLQSYLERHPELSYREVRDLFSQLLTVVGFAHAQGVLHRDLKPLNILREPTGRLKVIDFGLARDQNQTVAYTQVGMPFAGSLEYMDPRVSLQMFGKISPTPSDQGTDQFALGGILFLMLTGSSSIDLPEELDAQGLLPTLSTIAEPRPSPRAFRPDLPEELERVVMTMQAVRVEDRYPSLDDAMDAFMQAIAPYVEPL